MNTSLFQDVAALQFHWRRACWTTFPLLGSDALELPPADGQPVCHLVAKVVCIAHHAA